MSVIVILTVNLKFLINSNKNDRDVLEAKKGKMFCLLSLQVCISKVKIVIDTFREPESKKCSSLMVRATTERDREKKRKIIRFKLYF